MKKFTYLILVFTYFFMIILSCGNNSEGSNNSELSATSLNAEETVRSFIENLGVGNFDAAFNLQNNETWGDITQFKSKNNFGGIVKSEILKIETKPDEDGSAVIYAEAGYEDAVNGDNTFKQTFYLKKFGGEWKIAKMKQVKNAETLEFKKYSASCDKENPAQYELIIELPVNNEILEKALMKIAGIYDEKGNTPQDKLNNYVAERCAEFKQEIQDIEDEGNETYTGASHSLTVAYNNGKLISVESSGAGYIGGIGQYHTNFYNLDIETGEEIDFTSIFNDTSLKSAKIYILEKYNKHFDTDVSLENAEFLTYRFSKKGLEFSLENASFIGNDSVLMITFKELEGKLSNFIKAKI